MRKSIDITGQIFGRLTVLWCMANLAVWECVCTCGNHTYLPTAHLINGNTKSCGCWSVEARFKADGLSRARIYNIWRGMIRRCSDNTHKSFHNYGGRGIAVCERWQTLENFLEDMGHPPDQVVTIDRKDNSLGYFKENCKWSTPKQQASNRRSDGKKWRESQIFRPKSCPLSAQEQAGS